MDHRVWGRRRATIRRTLASVAALLALAAGCTSEPERDLPDVDVGSPSEAATPSLSPGGPADIAAPGRLAVIDGAANLVTVDPDGSGEIVLAAAEPGVLEARQPTWSPDGARVAWVQLEAAEDGVSAVVATANADGARPTESAIETAPFYLSWDPTSSRIAYLGSASETDIELGIVEVEDGEATPLDTGQPFYLSWAPGGDEMLVHVGEDRLERLALDGSLTTVADRPGTFRAPAWTADGRSLVYAVVDDDGQRLVVHDVERDAGRDLVRFEGSISFVVSPDGGRIAYQVLDDQGPQPLSVVDVASGEIEELTGPELVVSFFWSPDGDRLLYQVLDRDLGQVWTRWVVWDGSSTFTTPRFVPSLVFGRDYLPFFEQYAQSMSLWAPDGSAFAYAGVDEAGNEGIWVQSARSDRAPVLVGDGVFVTWSPA